MDKLNHPIDATFTFKFKPCIKNVFPLKYVFVLCLKEAYFICLDLIPLIYYHCN